MKKPILYLGLEVPSEMQHLDLVHCPLIRTVPRSLQDADLKLSFELFDSYTHLIFTSKTSVSIFFDYAPHFGIHLKEICRKILVAVGKKTAAKLSLYCQQQASILTASEETAEGVILLLSRCDLKDAYLFWPHSALARPLLSEWLNANCVKHCSCIFYDTVPMRPAFLPDPSHFSEIIFTSPSTVDAFVSLFKSFPRGVSLTAIGPITERYLEMSAL
jgi:uroporphyrinogen-III synthase